MDKGGIVFQSRALVKRYNDTLALDNVSLVNHKAKIYGLIGQNGAGKTTLIKIIAGLIFPTSGDIELFGNGDRLELVRKQCGFMIESSGLNTSMSAKDNLLLHAIIKDIKLSDADIEELLNLVGLENTKKKTRSYSLGMKQRLGIALALLGYPQYLVLDEPINGLDPIGVVVIRDMLKRLCEEKQMTILISSHNLPELYQTATDFIIIDQGRIVEEVSQKELEEKCRQYVRIKTDDLNRLIHILEHELGTSDYQTDADGTVRVYGFCDQLDDLARLFHYHHLLITTLAVEGSTLEDYFISLVGGGDNEKSA